MRHSRSGSATRGPVCSAPPGAIVGACAKARTREGPGPFVSAGPTAGVRVPVDSDGELGCQDCRGPALCSNGGRGERRLFLRAVLNQRKMGVLKDSPSAARGAQVQGPLPMVGIVQNALGVGVGGGWGEVCQGGYWRMETRLEGGGWRLQNKRGAHGRGGGEVVGVYCNECVRVGGGGLTPPPRLKHMPGRGDWQDPSTVVWLRTTATHRHEAFGWVGGGGGGAATFTMHSAHDACTSPQNRSLHPGLSPGLFRVTDVMF